MYGGNKKEIRRMFIMAQSNVEEGLKVFENGGKKEYEIIEKGRNMLIT